jgi:hypothetical protein
MATADKFPVPQDEHRVIFERGQPLLLSFADLYPVHRLRFVVHWQDTGPNGHRVGILKLVVRDLVGLKAPLNHDALAGVCAAVPSRPATRLLRSSYP